MSVWLSGSVGVASFRWLVVHWKTFYWVLESSRASIFNDLLAAQVYPKWPRFGQDVACTSDEHFTGLILKDNQPSPLTLKDSVSYPLHLASKHMSLDCEHSNSAEKRPWVPWGFKPFCCVATVPNHWTTVRPKVQICFSIIGMQTLTCKALELHIWTPLLLLLLHTNHVDKMGISRKLQGT